MDRSDVGTLTARIVECRIIEPDQATVLNKLEVDKTSDPGQFIVHLNLGKIVYKIWLIEFEYHEVSSEQ